VLQKQAQGLIAVPYNAISYQQALKEICALEKFGSKLGLERITRMLRLLGNPQKRCRCILVGGSNGKGSTVEMIGSILKEDGFSVGTYFSPQIEEFPERIRVDGRNAGKKEIASAYAEVNGACSSNRIPATFFEVVTAMALLIFARRKCDAAVLEVGLGGRLDATNAVEPEISAIASLSLEHTDVLGRTIAAIAHEKCGIARKGRKLVCGFLREDAKEAVKEECKKIGARPLFVEDAVKFDSVEEKGGRYSFKAEFGSSSYDLSLCAPGEFQVSNALAALAVCREMDCGRKAIEKGLAAAKPKYRFQAISRRPLVIADCAHNPEAAAVLASEVKKIPSTRKVLLFSAMRDKDYAEVLGILAPCFDEIVLTQVSLKRSATIGELQKAARKAGATAFQMKKPKSALMSAKKRAGRGGLLMIAGSIYLLAELFGRDKRRMAQ